MPLTTPAPAPVPRPTVTPGKKAKKISNEFSWPFTITIAVLAIMLASAWLWFFSDFAWWVHVLIAVVFIATGGICFFGYSVDKKNAPQWETKTASVALSIAGLLVIVLIGGILWPVVQKETIVSIALLLSIGIFFALRKNEKLSGFRSSSITVLVIVALGYFCFKHLYKPTIAGNPKPTEVDSTNNASSSGKSDDEKQNDVTSTQNDAAAKQQRQRRVDSLREAINVISDPALDVEDDSLTKVEKKLEDDLAALKATKNQKEEKPDDEEKTVVKPKSNKLAKSSSNVRNDGTVPQKMVTVTGAPTSTPTSKPRS